MANVALIQCGGTRKQISMNVDTNDFAIEINNKSFRFDIDQEGNISILMINGIDIKVFAERGYAGVKLIKS